MYVDGWDEGLEDAGENNNVVVSDDQDSADKNEEAEKDDQVEKDEAAEKDEVADSTSESEPAEKANASNGVELLADEEEAYNSLSGRDYVGQVTKEINGETYILIGNEQQLRAIGSGKRVVGGQVYKIEQEEIFIATWRDVEGAEILPYYSGDADLSASETLLDSVDDHSSERYGDGLVKRDRYFCIVDDEQVPLSESEANSGLTYSSNANYIIFRNINLSQKVVDEPADNLWTPLMFSGTMIGARAENEGTIWDKDATSITAAEKPVISGIIVNHSSTEMDTSQYTGVGFFGTLTNQTDDFGLTTKASSVSNLMFDTISVTSNAQGVRQDTSFIEGLSGVLGSLVGGILDIILSIFGVKLNLSDLLTGLLTIQNNDPSTFAVGAFAGRIIGDVTVKGVDVRNASVHNNNRGMVGGFVGYTSGTTQYEGLTTALGKIVDLLSGLLNIIPGLGLGDLVTILLNNNIINVSQLIPTGYDSPIIASCTVTNLNASESDGPVGNKEYEYAGGFAGVLVATTVSGSTVAGASFDVEAKNYAGGFAGAIRNGSVDGTLGAGDLLKIELWDNTPQSIVYSSSVSAGGVSVTADECYAGGFAGALAQAYVVNSNIELQKTDESSGITTEYPLSVTSGEGYAGGFSGVATTGWETDLGKDEKDDSSLLGTVNGLLVGILSGTKEGNPEPLLALVGIKESVLLGTGVSGSKIDVHVTNGSYAGGIIGTGKGAVIAGTLDVNEDGERFLDEEIPEKLKNRAGISSPEDKDAKVSGLNEVAAAGDYAGGIARMLGVASGGGLLDSTLGLANVMPFVVSGVTVDGPEEGLRVIVGYTEETAGTSKEKSVGSALGHYAAGGIGLAVGGRMRDVAISNVSEVSAENYAGGFLGAAGTGSVAQAGGIDLLGLGLVEVGNLLSLGSAVQTKVKNADVSGIDSGMSVQALDSGTHSAGTTAPCAGGFMGIGSAVQVEGAHVANLLDASSNMTNGEAGGFVGRSTTAGLADVGDSATVGGFIENGILNIDGLLGAITYLLPTYTDVDVTFVDGGHVDADSAGGFAGVFESGTVDNTSRTEEKDWFAVYNLDAVNGGAYAGGFGGNVYSGALADAAGGVSILGGLGSGITIDLSQLLNVLSVYIPTIKGAGVKSSERGLAVSATALRDLDAESGSAGGFIGYGSGVQVSSSDVDHLRHTTVTEPADLEGQDGSAYFSLGEGEGKSSYAVTAARYAGGYIGYMNIGSAASVGKGLGVLGDSLSLNDIAGALQVVASTIEHSDAIGSANGFAVLGSDTVAGKSGAEGHSGGFAGKISGGHIQDSNCRNFSYVIGQVAAGGYAGEVEPGNVADVLGDVSTDEGGLLNGLIGTDGLASVLQVFVPSIRNSETTCIPCGGAVRAQASSDATTLRGMAGGYVGHNVGGQIWGNSSKGWKDEVHDAQLDEYTGPQREAAAVRIRSVYGAEYAGGFTGLMEAGDTASTGSLGLLWNLVSVDNLLGALGVAYPTEENTAVYGPLAKLDVTTWNAWVEAVGKYGGYGASLASQTFESTDDGQAQLDALLASYLYGMNVVAGRSQLAGADEANAMKGGSAGGYVGAMVSGTITNGQAHDVKLVQGMRAAGGSAGIAESGGAATLGSVSILGINLNLGQLLEAAEVFVPVIKNSSVEGYRLGMTVASQGAGSRSDDISNATGNAGGYIGYGAGVQIWGDGTTELGDLVEVKGGSAAQDAQAAEKGVACNVANLRRVVASAYAGGYAGRLTSGSTANVNTDGVSDGFIQKLLDTIIGNTGLTNLASVLQATMSTVRGSSVSAADEGWGFTVEAYRTDEKTTYPLAAGGFVGLAQATVMGERNGTDADRESACVTVNDLRGVEGGLYSGGFVGLAETGGVAEVAGGTGEGSSTSLLDILKLGSVEVIQAFQPFIYDGTVNGVADGVVVSAHTWDEGGLLGSKRMSGNAGGFAGTIMGGEVLRGVSNDMNSVSAPNYAGGFVGYTGKTGIADVEDVSALEQLGNILGLTAGVANVIGTTVEDSRITGIPGGYTVASQGTAGTAPESGAGSDGTGEQIAGGFAGYADLAHITNCDAGNLKLVRSAQVAGGFAGETSFAYLISAKADSALLNAALSVLDQLVKLLYLDDLQNLDAIKINLLGQALSLDVLSDGNVLTVWLLGIKISVSLAQGSDKHDDVDDFVNVTIGDSQIKLSCNKDGIVWSSDDEKAEVTVNLIKGNRSEVTDCSVTGIAAGYDVFGGGATQTSEGSGASGYAGGFVGHNNEGKLTGNEMLYADVVSGTAEKTGPFSGATSYNSTYWFNNIEDIDQGNTYHVYRDASLVGLSVANTSNMKVAPSVYDTGVPGDATEATVENASWARFDVSNHKPAAGSNHGDWANATVAPAGGEEQDLEVYVSASKAKLMDDTAVSDNTGGLTPEPGDGQDPCAARVNVTIQKVWNDGGDSTGARPESITVKLTATYTDDDGATVTPAQIWLTDEKGVQAGEAINNPMTITLTENDDISNWTETWRKVTQDLPVAFVDEGGTLRYYTYTASEVGGLPDDYLVSYEADGNENVITITNSLPLPNTGGSGTFGLLATGLATVVAGGLWLSIRRKRMADAARYRGAHFRV